MNKDQEIAHVTAQLDAVLDELQANVAALEEILTRPAPGGGEKDERLVPQ